MQTLKIDMLKFVGARHFKAKDGIDQIAIPVDMNNIFRGEKGLYCSLTIMENRDGVDQYGNEGFASVDLGKDRRMSGEKGPILGNWKTIGQRPPNQNTAPPPSSTATADALDMDEQDDIPF